MGAADRNNEPNSGGMESEEQEFVFDLPPEDFVGFDPGDNSQENPASPVTIKTNEDRHEQIRLAREREELRRAKGKNFDKRATTLLRIGVATVCALIVGLQLWQCDDLIRTYVSSQKMVPSEILISWMSATVVEVIGLMWVIARSLFPFRDKQRDKEAEKRADGNKVHLDVS